MDDAVHEVDVVLVEIVGRVHGDDRLQRGRIAHRHVDGVEAAPGDPNIPTLPVEKGCFESQSMTASPSVCSWSLYS